MKRNEKILTLACMAASLFGTGASAMHIMEGYLPKGWCVFWLIVCLPFVAIGLRRISKFVQDDPKNLTLLALCGAFAFVLSALKIPSVTGSCSHPTGVGLGAILFGPTATAVLGLIVLLFQALLLAHGGLTTLGANVFSMAIVGPVCSWVIYRGLNKVGCPKAVAVFAAAFAGDLLTYITTSIELGAAYPGDALMLAIGKFMAVFAITQIPLAIAEGLLTVVVFQVLEKYSSKELKHLGVL